MHQPPRLRLVPVFLGLIFALQACALPGVPVQQAEDVQPTYDPVRLDKAHSAKASADNLDNLKEGDSATFQNGFLSRMGPVSIGREYFSASGRLCKQILNVSGDALVGVACKRQNEQWYTRQGS